MGNCYVAEKKYDGIIVLNSPQCMSNKTHKGRFDSSAIITKIPLRVDQVSSKNTVLYSCFSLIP